MQNLNSKRIRFQIGNWGEINKSYPSFSIKSLSSRLSISGNYELRYYSCG